MRKRLLFLGGLLLLFVGAYSLPMEGLPYTRTHTAKIGPFEASARTSEKLDVPAPIGWLLVMAGVGLSLAGAYSKPR